VETALPFACQFLAGRCVVFFDRETGKRRDRRDFHLEMCVASGSLISS
jgi:hypothetical protein